ncbi:M16 family metallopeptidase [Moraxella nasicaprae]|uniref:Insulinase family protein n=1 Tax=Moraxella nasicaprae TaxID=2904122 RepID=A0ABY6F4C9_9GAMM|nr:pitrilysin family protein [Moraxella nasicaprae]UXZ04956.1 insulinase family protein [Moraxella nasicaprae]
MPSKPISFAKTTALGLIAGSALSLLACTTPATQQLSYHTPSKTAQDTHQNHHKQQVVDYTLDNGLRVIIKPQKSPLVMTQIWYKVGSNDEPVGKGGLSHFLEHMMFKDSAGIDGDVYDQIVSQVGGSRNAFTTSNYTSYYQLLPANQYPLGLEIESNRMRGLVFDDEKLAKEKEVVKEERRQRTDDSPMAKAFEEFAPALFPDNNNARPIIGYMNEIEGLNKADLQAWYDTYYYANNAVLVIVGGVNVDEAKHWVQKYFAHLPSRPMPKRPSLHQKSHRGYQHIISHQQVTVPSLLMAFNTPTIATTDAKEAYALELVSDLLNGSQSARLRKNLLRNKQMVSQINVHYDAHDFGDGVLMISATPREGVSLDEVSSAILAQIDELAYGQIAPHELQRGQVGLKAALILRNDSITGQARSLGQLAVMGLGLDTPEKMPKLLAQIGTTDIQRVIKKYLTKDNLSVMYVLPKAKPVDDKK